MSARPCSRALFTWRSAVTDPQVGPASAAGVSRRTLVHVAVTGLSLHMSAEGSRCFPSVGTVAAETGLHRRTVQRAIDVLEEQGWLRVQRRRGRGRTNRYEVAFPLAVELLLAAQRVAVKGDMDEPVKGDMAPLKGGTTPPFASEKVAGDPGKGGRVPPELFSKEELSSSSAAAVRDQDRETADRTAVDEWVRVWWWARARGVREPFPQLRGQVEGIGETLSFLEYLRLRDRWRADGAPDLTDPVSLASRVNGNSAVSGSRQVVADV